MYKTTVENKVDRTYYLPHPIRVTCTEEYEAYAKEKDKVFDSIVNSELDINNISCDHFFSLVKLNFPNYVKAIEMQENSEHLAGIKIICDIQEYKYRKCEGTIFTTSNSLDFLLKNTDIGNEIPLAYLRPPFKNCYIEFTTDRSSEISLLNSSTGLHILEGVYISETEILPNTEASSLYEGFRDIDIKKPFRVIDLMFTGSPIKKADNRDDTLRSQGFYIQNQEKTILEEIEDIKRDYGNDDDFTNDLDYLLDALNHMAKVLLFINSKQYRDTAFNERKEIIKKISSLKSTSKIRKYERKLRTAYNRTIISPKDDIHYLKEDSDQHPSNTKPKKAHWRRGHFKMQPYGPRASQRKIIFIEPVVVGGAFAKKHKYTAKEKISDG